jgi:ribonuclease HI
VITAAADGSALGNPGPAGWAWYVDDDHWAAGGWPHGTNNQGELMAVIDLLDQTAGLPDNELHILCDSQYVINSVTKWMPGWKRKGWRKSDGSPVLNRDLLERLDAALDGRNYRFEWVKGHAGHALNEAADERARAVATAYQAGAPIPTGPGYSGAERATRAAGAAAPEAVPAAATRSAPGAEPEPADIALFDLSEQPDERERVLALERALLDPQVRSDPGEVAALLHTEFEEVGASGRIWDRDTMIAALTDDPAGVDAVSGMDVVALGDEAMLVRYRVTAGGATTERSSLWQRVGGTWRLRYHQGTPAL